MNQSVEHFFFSRKRKTSSRSFIREKNLHEWKSNSSRLNYSRLSKVFIIFQKNTLALPTWYSLAKTEICGSQNKILFFPIAWQQILILLQYILISATAKATCNWSEQNDLCHMNVSRFRTLDSSMSSIWDGKSFHPLECQVLHTKCMCACYCTVYTPSKWLRSPKTQSEFISFMCCCYVRTQIFAFFSCQCAIVQAFHCQSDGTFMPKMANDNVYSNPIWCKWTFEMFEVGISVVNFHNAFKHQ